MIIDRKFWLSVKYLITKSAKNLWAFFLDLIFPVACLGCGQENEWLCGQCFKNIKLKNRQYCLHCKKENDFGQFCPPCRIIYPHTQNAAGASLMMNEAWSHEAGNEDHHARKGAVVNSLNGVWIAALYDEALVSRAIKSLKYYFMSGLAADLSRLLTVYIDKMLEQSRILKPGLAHELAWRDFKRAKNLPQAILNFKDNLVMPVPLSKRRLRWRGFNQAELLARKVAEEYSLKLDSRSLTRIKHKKPQAKLNEINRLENIKDCFYWQAGDLNKKNIILIDDVVTTGATLNECAKVLKQNGAGEVWGLVVAKG